MLYKLISFCVTNLVNIILIMKPNNLVKSAPIIKIKVDFRNLFFIIKLYVCNFYLKLSIYI